MLGRGLGGFPAVGSRLPLSSSWHKRLAPDLVQIGAALIAAGLAGGVGLWILR